MKCASEGRPNTDLMFVGESPGWQEDKCGRPFVGATGDEMGRFLDGKLLPRRRDVYLTNLYRYYGGKDYEFTAADLERDEPDLIDDLQRCQPRVIVPLGRAATRYFLGDVDVGEVQGIPWLTYVPALEREVVVLPIVHPAAGLHNPEMCALVVSGFQALAAYLAGGVEPRRLFDDPYAGKEHYEAIETVERLREIFSRRRSSNCAVDTEGWPGAPWSLQFSFEPGTGYFIGAADSQLLAEFGVLVRDSGVRLCFHSALHDLGMGRELGNVFEGRAFDDTMIMAYLLQTEEKGLKPLCVRHCGMQMQSYDDLMGDTANRLILDYCTWIWDSENESWEEHREEELARINATPLVDAVGHPKRRKDGSIRYHKLTKAPSLPKSRLHKAVERVIQSKRPAGLWNDQIEDVRCAAHRLMGPTPQATLDYVPRAAAVHYACRDADGTDRVAPILAKRIDALGLRDVYELELSTYPLIDRMHRVGLKPDVDYLQAFSNTELAAEIERLRVSLCGHTGDPEFNANSGDQVAAYLFDTLGLESIKNTPSGRGSTNDKILEALMREHPEIEELREIRQYREFYKLKHTFLDTLPEFVNRWPYDGRIHASFRTTTVVTGRLAASEPNVLAQPEHGAFAPNFKRGWVAEPGHVICAWDESQVELRGLAHLSQDAGLLAIYRGEVRGKNGEQIDLHAEKAQRIFGGRVEDYMHKCNERLAAKAVNFGIPMGMTAVGLSVELRKNGVDADEDTAQRWLDETLESMPGVQQYIADRIEEARRTGMVRCMSGRIRYIGGINSRDRRVRAEAERFAFSTPIQESAQFIMKQAEAQAWELLTDWWKRGRWVEPLVQIHDCLKLEVEERWAQELNVAMVRCMTQVPKSFSVPLEVEGEWGHNMGPVARGKDANWNPEGMRGF